MPACLLMIVTLWLLDPEHGSWSQCDRLWRETAHIQSVFLFSSSLSSAKPQGFLQYPDTDLNPSLPVT